MCWGSIGVVLLMGGNPVDKVDAEAAPSALAVGVWDLTENVGITGGLSYPAEAESEDLEFHSGDPLVHLVNSFSKSSRL